MFLPISLFFLKHYVKPVRTYISYRLFEDMQCLVVVVHKAYGKEAIVTFISSLKACDVKFLYSYNHGFVGGVGVWSIDFSGFL